MLSENMVLLKTFVSMLFIYVCMHVIALNWNEKLPGVWYVKL